MNRLHAMTMIQRAALDDGIIEPKDIFTKLRNVFPTSGSDAVMLRGEVEAFAQQSIQLVADARFPVERERMRLDIAEGELRADLLDAIATLSLEDPAKCRELYELHRKVGGSTGAPTIREAIDILAVDGYAEDGISAFVARLEALYPKQEDNDDGE